MDVCTTVFHVNFILSVHNLSGCSDWNLGKKQLGIRKLENRKLAVVGSTT